ncbi:transcriptional regulator [Arthrobacter psychrolactophilus]|uniref:Transcriptional regulator n=1 Tax=Arthrobacter psychrolactophilus TaxID=92442 RepID=A0A2V5IWU3_9MICC|nr:helix-turn-helix domain-containing protein [Arthrobacter psychrolactophilus]PYI38733.1 transcriptional regulator [Arthrobacter psychrolactophilus]
MPRMSQALTDAVTGRCAIARTLGVLADSWSFLLIREAHLGRRTFAEFRDSLGIATDVLGARLEALVDHGIFERVPYQEPGQRTRDGYELTSAGNELKIVLIAMQQWGEEHLPHEQRLAILPVTADGQDRVRAELLGIDGTIVAQENVEFRHITQP